MKFDDEQQQSIVADFHQFLDEVMWGSNMEHLPESVSSEFELVLCKVLFLMGKLDNNSGP